jgi:transcription elongation factor GreA
MAKNALFILLSDPVEADPLEGRISNESPIGAAIFGKKVGDKATVETSKGK